MFRSIDVSRPTHATCCCLRVYGVWTKQTSEISNSFYNFQNELRQFYMHCIRKQEDRMRFYAEGKFCQFDITKLGPCVEGNHGFDSASPCLILKLNKIFGLEHEYHEDTALPEEMPAELKYRIGAATDKNQVWVSCKAEFPADKEGVESLELFPKDGGFPSYYFPYLKQENYQSPLVAVRINNITPGQLIHVECRAWAKNIKYNRRDRVGIVRFEVMNHNDQTTEEVNKMN